eukprot:m.302525 g.302525  ORF g.302525 m.302525 type:complete len:403 (+) comp15250_c0_seq1:41-1249(+)
MEWQLLVAGAAAVVGVAALVLAAQRRTEARAPVVEYAVEEATDQNQQQQQRFLVTGGCGFLGKHLLKALQQRYGGDVRLVCFDLVIPPSTERLAGVSYVRGSLLEPDHTRRALDGISTVFHVASIVPSLRTERSPLLYRVNVEGTRNIIEGCKAARVGALVYTSSATVVLDRNDYNFCGGDESAPFPETHIDQYTRSKRDAEGLVQAANSDSLAVCILRPAAIFGEGDKLVSDVHKSHQGDHFVIGDGQVYLDWVYVGDVAAAHVLAGAALEDATQRAKVAGNVYNIGGCFDGNRPDMTYAQFIGAGDGPGPDHWGRDRPQIIPMGLVKVLAKVNELVFRLTGFVLENSLSSTSISFLERTFYFDSARARDDLGYHIKEPIAATIARLAAEAQQSRQDRKRA